MTDHRSVAVAAARDAGDILLGLFNKPQPYKMKNERDIQIDADLKSEQAIKNKIRSAFPDHGIFAEESGKEREDSEYQWVIDPLDGTITVNSCR
jgi:fructose-1,6-bisphosphatase/inositol monophosphatase family enzyme